MHKIYVTEGVVLVKRGVGEANIAVTMLTQELGLIRAFARSARKEVSKLRYGLETLTLGRFTLVKGKHEWRLIGVEKVSREGLDATAARRRALGRISKLLLRLVQGEEPVPALYAAVSEGFQFISQAANETDAEAIECVLVLRILSILGYLPQTSELQPFINDSFFSLELAASAARSRTFLIKAINESLGATGL